MKRTIMIMTLMAIAIGATICVNGSSYVERTAPFYLTGKHQSVDVMINGKGPYRFLFDTGAGETSIDKALASELQLKVTGRSTIGDPQNPDAYQTELVELPRIEIGNMSFKRVTAMSYDLSQIFPKDTFRGVIGMPLFANSLLTIDYPNSRLTTRRGSLPPANGKDVIDFTMSDGSNFTIKLSVAGISAEAVIDTGSSGGITLPRQYATMLKLDSELKETGTARTVNNTLKLYGANLNGTLTIGSHSFDHPPIVFNDVLPIATIGYQVLKDFTITIDQKNLRIQLRKPAKN